MPTARCLFYAVLTKRSLNPFVPADIQLDHEALSIGNSDIPHVDVDYGSHVPETRLRIVGFASRCRASRPYWPSVSDILDASDSSGSGNLPTNSSWKYILYERPPNHMDSKGETGKILATCFHDFSSISLLSYSSFLLFLRRYSLSIRH